MVVANWPIRAHDLLLLCYNTLFYTGFSHRCTTITATWNLISRARFRVGEHNTKVSFSLSKLRYGPFGFNPRKFAKIWQIKWNWIRSMKFETVRIYFFKWIFGLLSSKHFATMVTWRNDFSSLSRRVVKGSLVACSGVQAESLIASKWLFFFFFFFFKFQKRTKTPSFPWWR